MTSKRGTALGLSIGEHRILAAKVRVSSRRAQVENTAEFIFPDGLSLQHGAELGRALGEFLKANRLTAGTAVVGLPAKWLLAKELSLPSASRETLPGMVRLEAERLFATDPSDLVIDCTETASAPGGAKTLLVAVARRRMNEITEMLEAARVKPAAVMPSSVVLSEALRGELSSSLTLSVFAGSAEVAVRRDGRIRALESLPLPDCKDSSESCVAAISSAVSRLLSGAPRSPEGSSAAPMVVWNDSGLDYREIRSLGEKVAMTVEPASGVPGLTFAVEGNENSKNDNRFLATAALALSAARKDTYAVDFLHSRLNPPGKRAIGRSVAWGAAAAVTVLAVCAAFFFQWRSEERDIAELKGRLALLQNDIRAARTVVDQVTLARDWTDSRPRFLEPLRELTLALPEEGRIWITNLAIRSDMRVLASGKSSEDRTVLELLDAIRSSPAFTGVKLLYLRDAGGGSREVVFAITFDFDGKE